MNESPLTSASPDSLSVLFESDPTTLTDDQLMSLINELRRRRNVFTAEEAAKATAPKSKRTKAEPSTPSTAAELDKPTSELSLDDL